MASDPKTPNWRLVIEALEALGGKASIPDISDYFKKHFPCRNPVNVQFEARLLAVNSQSRVSYSGGSKIRRTDSGNPYDRLYLREDGYYEFYDQARHGIWEIAKNEQGKLYVRQVLDTTDERDYFDASDPLRGFGTPEDRKRVEQAAERAVIEHFQNNGFEYERVTHLPCGFDFVFSKGKTTLNVEVKGTSGITPQFFLTRNEHKRGFSTNPFWRLAMVTAALDEPKICVYDARQLKEAFDLDPYVYIGKFIPKVDSD